LRTIRTLLDSLASSRSFAVVSILLLQLKVIWGIWSRKDLTTGDTASYYLLAQSWHTSHAVSIVWSPLYTAYYGSFLNLSSDVYAVTIAHRIVIIFALCLLVLALMRSLLPPVLAWFATAHWVVMPINFDSLYEVHLFYVVLIVIAFLAVLHLPGALGRISGAGLFFLFAVLMRNELFVVFVLFASIALGYDIQRFLRDRPTATARVFLGYAVALLAALLVCAFFYQHAMDKWPSMKASLSGKHTLNVCQIYAFGYQQRHPEWKNSPWTDCQPLILSTFGQPEVTLLEATQLNPSAMTDHYLWNLKLVPSGLQVLLFNVMSGRVNPDYVEVPVWPIAAIAASCILLAIWIWGAVIFFKNPCYWYQKYLKPNTWGWIAMASVGSVAVIVMIVERPRPSYLFTLGLLIAAWTGISIAMITARWNWITQLRPLFPAAVVGAILLTPSYYYYRWEFKDRPALDVYRHASPLRQLIAGNVGVVAPVVGPELCFYLSSPGHTCNSVEFGAFRNSLPAGADWNAALATRNVRFVLVNEKVLSDPPGSAFVASANSQGWQTIEEDKTPGKRWVLLRRQ
jgi:hypothetical protein